jgi:hypothetical protein
LPGFDRARDSAIPTLAYSPEQSVDISGQTGHLRPLRDKISVSAQFPSTLSMISGEVPVHDKPSPSDPDEGG